MDRQIAFRVFVAKTKNLSRRKPDGHIDAFSKLPLEIRQEIYSHMDPSSLFRAQQVNRMMRKETQPLFWSLPGVWYAYNPEPFKSIPHIANGIPNECTLLPAACLMAMKHVERVLVEVKLCDSTFWSNMESFFPSLRQVMLMGNLPGNPPLWNRARSLAVEVYHGGSYEWKKTYFEFSFETQRKIRLSDAKVLKLGVGIDNIVQLPRLGGTVAAFLSYKMIATYMDSSKDCDDTPLDIEVLNSSLARQFRVHWEMKIMAHDRKQRLAYRTAFANQLLEDPTFAYAIDPEESPIFRQLGEVLLALNCGSYNNRATELRRPECGDYLWRRLL